MLSSLTWYKMLRQKVWHKLWMYGESATLTTSKIGQVSLCQQINHAAFNPMERV